MAGWLFPETGIAENADVSCHCRACESGHGFSLTAKLDFPHPANDHGFEHALIALGIHRAWRSASVGGLAFYLEERIYVWNERGFKFSFLGLIISLAFVNSIRATYWIASERRTQQVADTDAGPIGLENIGLQQRSDPHISGGGCDPGGPVHHAGTADRDS
jgi:hypothetical protein